MGIKKRVQKKVFVKKEVVEEIISPAARILNFFSQNLKESIAALSILFIAVVFFFAWRMYSASLENNAQVVFTDAYKYYTTAVTKGNPSDFQMAANRLNDLVSKYPRTSTAKNALIYLGNCCFRLNDFINASKNYTLFLENSSKDNKTFREFAYEGLGYASEQSGKYDQAVFYFKKAVEEGVSPTDSGLLNLARAYEELKQNDKAIELYQKILKDYPQSENAQIAKDRLFSLKGNVSK